MKRHLYHFYFLLFVVIHLTACSTPVCCSKSETQLPINKKVLPKPDISIIAVGDIMLGTNFPDDRTAADDGAHLLSGVSSVLRNADITFGNLEGVLMQGGVAAKKCKNPISCYVFRSPPHYANYLKKAGFDVVSLANNHARDFGEEGRSASMDALDHVGLLHSGRVGDVARWQVKGVSISFIAYAPFGGSHDLLDIPLAQKQIAYETTVSDLVLVSIHAGAEGKNVMHVPFQHEMFYNEDRGDVVEFSHAAIDAGADLVVGHGPHVPRALELYKNRLIAYSLGNFATYRGIKISGENGIAPILSATITAVGEFKTGKIISARQFRPAGTQLDPSQHAAVLIEKLTKQDFPNTPLVFSSDGLINRRILLK